jgi:hypothetical protein
MQVKDGRARQGIVWLAPPARYLTNAILAKVHPFGRDGVTNDRIERRASRRATQSSFVGRDL